MSECRNVVLLARQFHLTPPDAAAEVDASPKAPLYDYCTLFLESLLLAFVTQHP